MKALWKSFVVLLVAGGCNFVCRSDERGSQGRRGDDSRLRDGAARSSRQRRAVRIRRDSGRRGKIVRTGSKGHFESNHLPGRFAIRANKRGVGHSSTMHVYLAGGQTINLPSIYIYPHRRVPSARLYPRRRTTARIQGRANCRSPERARAIAGARATAGAAAAAVGVAEKSRQRSSCAQDAWRCSRKVTIVLASMSASKFTSALTGLCPSCVI